MMWTQQPAALHPNRLRPRTATRTASRAAARTSARTVARTSARTVARTSARTVARTSARAAFGRCIACLALCCVVASAASAQDADVERPRLLVLQLTGDSVPEEERRTLTTLIGVEVASLVDYDVVTTQELEKLLTVEKDRQLLGCLDASCLAEVADAMGTERIVFGEIGKLGTTMLLTLSLFDSLAARATQRVVVKSKDVDGFVDKLPQAIRDLTASLRADGESAPQTVATSESSASESGASQSSSEKGETSPLPSEKSNGAAATSGTGGGIDLLAISGWSMVGVGGVVAAVGMVYDVFAPSSGDYELGLDDAIGPGIVFTGAFIAAGGAALALGPGLLEEGEDTAEEPDGASAAPKDGAAKATPAEASPPPPKTSGGGDGE